HLVAVSTAPVLRLPPSPPFAAHPGMQRVVSGPPGCAAQRSPGGGDQAPRIRAGGWGGAADPELRVDYSDQPVSLPELVSLSLPELVSLSLPELVSLSLPELVSLSLPEPVSLSLPEPVPVTHSGSLTLTLTWGSPSSTKTSGSTRTCTVLLPSGTSI